MVAMTHIFLKCITIISLILGLTYAFSPPNIIVILADDLGYNDVSWHNSEIIMPHIEELAKNGIILNNHYVQASCSPSRSALLTGYYPIHTGMQVIFQFKFYLFTYLPKKVSIPKYYTHAIL